MLNHDHDNDEDEDADYDDYIAREIKDMNKDQLR